MTTSPHQPGLQNPAARVLKAEIAVARQKAAQPAKRARLSPEERARRERRERREARRKREIENGCREWQQELDRRDQAVNALADFLVREIADQGRLLDLIEAAKSNSIDFIRRQMLEAGGMMNAVPFPSDRFMNLSSTWIFNEAHSVAAYAAQQPARLCNRRIA